MLNWLKVVGADDDPVVKLREKVKLIQDRVGKVLENIVVPDTPTVAMRQKETKRNSEFDMDAWRREREKIRYNKLDQACQTGDLQWPFLFLISLKTNVNNMNLL